MQQQSQPAAQPRQLQQPLSHSMQQNPSVGPRSQRKQGGLSESDQPPRPNEKTLEWRADGSGYYEQQVFYATERNFEAKGKSYGTQQLIPLRYGVVPVRIPKKREPGHERAYNLPFTVKGRKDSDKNGRYNVSLYNHRAETGPERLMQDYDHKIELDSQKIGEYERFRAKYSNEHWGYKPSITTCLPSCACCPGLGSRSGIKEGDCFADIDRQSSSRQQFLSAVKQAVKASERQEVVVFIHGYNVSNEAALKSAAQFVFDTAQDYSGIDYPGKFVFANNQRVAVAFDWSSHSRLYSYGFVPCIQDDRERAAEAGPKLAHLLLDLAEVLTQPERDGTCACKGIHILAHSMGNYVLHYAMQHLSGECRHTAVTADSIAVQSLTAAEAGTEAAAAPAARHLMSVPEIAGSSAVTGACPAEATEHGGAEAEAAAAAGPGFKVPPVASAAPAAGDKISAAGGGDDDVLQTDQQPQALPPANHGLDRPQLSAAVAAIAAATAAGTPSRPSTAANVSTADAAEDAIPTPPAAPVAATAGTSDDPDGISALLTSSTAGTAQAQDVAAESEATAPAAADNGAAGAGGTATEAPSTTAAAAAAVQPVAETAPAPAEQPAAAAANDGADADTAPDTEPAKEARRFTTRQRLESLPSPFLHSRHIHREDDSHEGPAGEVDASGSGPPAGRSSSVKGKVAKISDSALIRHHSATKLFGILRTVIHAAADVSRDDIEDTILTVRAGAMIHGKAQPQVTHYSSRRDQALCVSSFLRMIGKRKDGRAGFFMRSPLVGHVFHPFLYTDVICVDATGFSKDPLGHGYFRDHRQVLTDITLALEGHTQPPHRSTITESKDGEEWKCQDCSNKVAPNPKVVLYRVMTVEQQHNQQLQQCRQQLNKLTRRLEALRTTHDFESWKRETQKMDLEEQRNSQSVLQEQLLGAQSSLQRLQQLRPRGLLTMVKSYFHTEHE